MSSLVFVYGSLKKGRGNHELLETSKLIAHTETKEARYTLVDFGPYPAVCQRGSSTIKGELYEVDDKTMQRLDMLEGYPSFYDRSRTLLANGEVAWMYHIDDLDLTTETIIETGEW